MDPELNILANLLLLPENAECVWPAPVSAPFAEMLLRLCKATGGHLRHVVPYPDGPDPQVAKLMADLESVPGVRVVRTSP